MSDRCMLNIKTNYRVSSDGSVSRSSKLNWCVGSRSDWIALPCATRYVGDPHNGQGTSSDIYGGLHKLFLQTNGALHPPSPFQQLVERRQLLPMIRLY